MIGDNGNNGPGPALTHIGSNAARRGDRLDAAQPDAADAVVQEPGQQRRRSSRTWSTSSRAAVAAAGTMTATAPAAHPGPGPLSARGSLEEPQVRAMFDRIAGLYDRMNTVMTAGLHHHWRRRAADLAARARRATARSTWPPAPATWRSSWPAGWRPEARWSASTSPSGCSSSRATRRPRRRTLGCASSPANALALPYRGRRVRRRHGRLRRAQLLRPRARAARDGPRRAPRRPGRRARDHHARSARRCRPSSSCGSTASSPRSAGWPATPRPTATCRARSGAFPGPRSWPRVMWRCGLRDDPLRAHRRRDHRAPRRGGA